MKLDLSLRVVNRTLSINAATHKPGSANHYSCLTERQHIQHAVDHLEDLMNGRDGDTDHLAHAATRLLLALEIRET